MAKRIKLGITGLSRSGKTVFISALVYHLTEKGGRLDGLKISKSDGFKCTPAREAPNSIIARFPYENHIQDITIGKWPEEGNGTQFESQLTLIFEYKSKSNIKKFFGKRKLYVDIIDYPGERLLDLPLLEKEYSDWSFESLEFSKRTNHKVFAKDYHNLIENLNPNSPYDEVFAKKLSDTFRDYLKKCKSAGLHRLPPGRFLQPGENTNSDSMTFAPLVINQTIQPDSYIDRFKRNYNEYKKHFVKKFFADTFSKVERQIVLVDMLSAINSGNEYLEELSTTLAQILSCFRIGKNSWYNSFRFNRKIDKVLFLATKVDLIFESDHKKFKKLFDDLIKYSYSEVETRGAEPISHYLSSVRTTMEDTDEEDLLRLWGIPPRSYEITEDDKELGEKIGVLPKKIRLPDSFDDLLDKSYPFQLINFQPKKIGRDSKQNKNDLSNKTECETKIRHIELDNVIQEIIGDKLK